MQHNEGLIEVLNDLVRINNDRMEGYEKAIEEMKPENHELVAIFRRMMEDSEGYKAELQHAIIHGGGKPDDDETTPGGRVYRLWMDIRAVVSGKNRKTILSSCEYGEDAAQKAYTEALESDLTRGIEIRQLIISQKNSLKKSA